MIEKRKNPYTNPLFCPPRRDVAFVSVYVRCMQHKNQRSSSMPSSFALLVRHIGRLLVRSIVPPFGGRGAGRGPGGK
ncbi:hypothetical protein VTJ04DRAFT_9943 [Mycothermus thermophilus]|uniref:uncharacterized protein n=1 Tax=Humicola insolens TaxID=85995 RepID=UPI003742D421